LFVGIHFNFERGDTMKGKLEVLALAEEVPSPFTIGG
jgi:hypothetical protein